MKSWTGGQWSLVRGTVGCWLVIHFAMLPPASWLVASACGLGILAGLSVAIGWREREACALACCLFVWQAVGDSLSFDPALLFVGGLLLLMAAMPPSAFGSWSARGRVDPRGDWHYPRQLYAAAWVLMGVAYGYSAFTKLDLAPGLLLESLRWAAVAVPMVLVALALIARARPWLWSALLAMHLFSIVLVDFSELSTGTLLLHLATFDPSWLPGKGEGQWQLFYDGECGLCQRAVRFLLAEDSIGEAFVFAPLNGDLAACLLEGAGPLPDSVVVRTSSGELWMKSRAILAMAQRLGGSWRALAMLGGAMPRPLLDLAYDGVARIRKRLFAKPESACPMLPPELGRRFRA